MKVTLIHGKYFNSWEALGLGYIGAYIREKFPSIDLNFFQGSMDTDDEIMAGCVDSDIVAFSCTTPSFPHAVDFARRLKAENDRVHVVVGGYHPSAIPEASLVPGIDQVVVGEGEDAMAQIISGNRERIVYGRPMHFTELAFPDRELIKNERNIQVAFEDNKMRITSVQSHRACPFKCKYCLDGFNKVLYPGVGSKELVRYRDVNNLLDEMELITRDYKLDLLKFSDPTWNTDIKWVKDFCRTKINRGISIPFYPNIHATVSDREMFHLMAEAGCYEIAIGIESGSPKILKMIGKGTTVKTIKQAVGWGKEAGLIVRGFFILGMPEEDDEDIILTRELADQLDLDEYGFTILCPYPGTQMYDPVKYADVPWETTDEYSNDFWHTNYLSNQQLKDWQNHLTERYLEKLTWHNRLLRGN